MSDRDSPDLPPPDRTGETLWVVDVTAPLAPSRVRWVAAEAAARLQLPAEKLVALLENRIGPVTKPLPKASADRVAEVLDLAGAEVAIRAAGPADGGRASVEHREASDAPSSDAAADGASEHVPVPTPVPATRPEPAPGPDPVAESVSETDAKPDPELGPEPGPRAGTKPGPAPTAEPATDAAKGARSGLDAEPYAERDAEKDAVEDIEEHVEVDARVDTTEDRRQSEAHVRNEATRTTTEGQRPVPRESAPEAPAVSEEGPSKPEGRPTEAKPPPPVGRPGATPRDGAARDDPWQSLGDEEDEAMLGAWSHRAGTAPVEPSAQASSTSSSSTSSSSSSSSSLDADRGAAARATRRPAPPAAAPGGRPTGATVPAFDPSDESRKVTIDRGRGSDGTEDDDEDEDEGWAYGLRDPFEEAERQERAMRRWALAVALLVALGIFLALQWAYSRPGLGDRTPPPYGVGLTAYRDGAFVSAARAWTPRAEAGDVEAMFMLGWMAEYGQGRPWSNREAAGWYGQAAQRGHAPSQLRLADLYARGLGVAFDPEMATRWYLAAAEAGLPRAQREAALAMAHDGRHDEAAAWLDRAAASDPDAAAWLALVDAARTLESRSE